MGEFGETVASRATCGCGSSKPGLEALEPDRDPRHDRACTVGHIPGNVAGDPLRQTSANQ